MASAIIGWYGPLIDLAKASSHLDDFVQLIVFVRSIQPVHKDNAPTGRSLLKTNIEVGDDTRSYFSISLWQKHMGSMVVAGDIILLQNIKIVSNRNVLEAATNHISTLLVLVHSYEISSYKEFHELASHCHVGETTKAKLRRVVDWVQRTESAFQQIQNVDSGQRKGQSVNNWKAYEGKKSRNCLSISEALCFTNSCIVNIDACIREIVLPSIFGSDEVDKEPSVSKRLFMMAKKDVVKDFICKGCKLCGSPIGLRSQSEFPLRCEKNSKQLHEICLIYRPFLLYVWDQGGQIPVLVKDKAARIMFGNISAENVYKCYKVEGRKPDPVHSNEAADRSNPGSSHPSKALRSINLADDHRPGSMQIECNGCRVNPNFYRIWLILVKVLLLQQDQNSPFRFEVTVDEKKDVGNGRFELIAFTMPCDGRGRS
ncbi:uncharacterized protein M6B38_339010 [Iris pallida]|uniref:Uncharacterized protein n=1 Tax=Iris pallida TaxID=29817 RepID=A0AAX6H060_IRIPA|nr:uncharacterized protein M6B38_339010 [Iris pallida]